MRAAILLALSVPLLAGGEPDPAEVRVTFDGHAVSYEVVNHLRYRIVEFQILTRFLSGGYEALGCSVRAEVKKPSDLVIHEACTIPRDSKTGEPVRYETRLVEVKYSNGLQWTPAESVETKKEEQ